MEPLPHRFKQTLSTGPSWATSRKRCLSWSRKALQRCCGQRRVLRAPAQPGQRCGGGSRQIRGPERLGLGGSSGRQAPRPPGPTGSGSQGLPQVEASLAVSGLGLRRGVGGWGQPRLLVCQTGWPVPLPRPSPVCPPQPQPDECSWRRPLPTPHLNPGPDTEQVLGTSLGGTGPLEAARMCYRTRCGSSELSPLPPNVPYRPLRTPGPLPIRPSATQGEARAPAGGRSWWLLSQPESALPRTAAWV